MFYNAYIFTEAIYKS